MIARRTPLPSRTELRRTPLARKSQMPRSRPRAKRPRDTGPTAATKYALEVRAGGRCEMCGGGLTGPWSRHHRLPRRMGGSKRPDINGLANLLLICGTATTGCHGRIESRRTWAYVNGYLLAAEQSPALVPVLYRGHLTYLAGDGTLTKEIP